jgi:predicted PurR-regulated permease PerM
MLGLESRAARAAWTIFLIALVLLVLFTIRRTLLIFTLAILLAYVLSPIVGFVDRFASRRVPRALSLAAVYLLLLAALSGAATTIGVRVAEEATSLARTLPDYIRNPQRLEQLPIPWWLKTQKEAIIGFVIEQIQSHQDQIVPVLTATGKSILGVLGSALFVVLVPILSFFLLKDAGQWRHMLLEQFVDPRRRGLAEDILADVHALLLQFMRAVFLVSLTTFLCYAVALSLLRVNYALLLSVLAGVVEVIPVAGPLFASLTILLVAGLGGHDGLWWIVLFLVIYRLILDYLIQPHLMSQGVELPPLAILFGILAGEQLGGVLGIFLSIPILATLRIIYVRYRKLRLASS